MTDSDSDHSAMSRDPRSAHGGRAASKGSKAGPKPNKYYPRTGKRGAPQAFPRKVFEILSEQPAEIISWTPSGLAFMIHDMPRFVSEVLQKYFAHQKFSSFQRQLNLYGYRRIEPGGDEPAGSYYHPSFRQDGEDLVGEVRRTPQSHRGRGGGRDSGRDRAWSGGGGSARSGARKRKARGHSSDESDEDEMDARADAGADREDEDEGAHDSKLRRTTRVAARAVRSRVRELARLDAEPDDDSSSSDDDAAKGDDDGDASDGADSGSATTCLLYTSPSPRD